MNWNSKIPYFVQAEPKNTVAVTLVVLAYLSLMVTGILGHLQIITGLNAASTWSMMTLGGVIALVKIVRFYLNVKKHPVYLHQLLRSNSTAADIRDFVREMGRDVNALVNGETALHIAVNQGNVSLIRALCLIEEFVMQDRRYHPNNRNPYIALNVLNNEHLRPIDIAIKLESVNLIKELADCGVSLDRKEGTLLAPLYKAVAEDNGRVVSLLLQAGADALTSSDYYSNGGSSDNPHLQAIIESSDNAIRHAMRRNKLNAFRTIFEHYSSKGQKEAIYAELKASSTIVFLRTIFDQMKDHFNISDQIHLIIAGVCTRSVQGSFDFLREVLSTTTFPFIFQRNNEAYFLAFVRQEYRQVGWFQEILKIFVESGKINLEERDKNGVSAMEYSVVHRDSEAIKILKNHVDIDGIAIQEMREVLVELDKHDLSLATVDTELSQKDVKAIKKTPQVIQAVFISNPYLHALRFTQGYSFLDRYSAVPKYTTLKDELFIKLVLFFKAYAKTAEKLTHEMQTYLFSKGTHIPLEIWNIVLEHLLFRSSTPMLEEITS